MPSIIIQQNLIKTVLIEEISLIFILYLLFLKDNLVYSNISLLYKYYYFLILKIEHNFEEYEKI